MNNKNRTSFQALNRGEIFSMLYAFTSTKCMDPSESGISCQSDSGTGIAVTINANEDLVIEFEVLVFTI